MAHTMTDTIRATMATCEQSAREGGWTGAWEAQVADLEYGAHQAEARHGRYPTPQEWEAAGYAVHPNDDCCSDPEMIASARALGRRGGSKRSPAQRAHSTTLHASSPHSGRATLVHDDRREWTRTRIWTTKRGWIVQMDRAIAGELSGERYAVDYSDRFPVGMDLAGGEGTTNAQALVHEIPATGRCLARGTVVR